MPGPPRKRSEDKVRRNLEDPIAKIEMVGPVAVPDLDIPNPHPLVRDLYESLKTSGQAKYYEPSDWQYARITMHFVNKLLRKREPSAMMLASINSMMTPLLMTEGERRRVRIEVERNQAEADVVDIAKIIRERLESPQAR